MRIGKIASVLKAVLSSSNNNRDLVKVFVILFTIPTEGIAFTTRYVDGRPIVFWVLSKEVYYALKRVRHRFYSILNKYALKTEVGYIVEEEKINDFMKELRTWLSQWENVRKLALHFITRPKDFADWPIIEGNIKKLGLTWPPKDLSRHLNKLRIEVVPITLPRDKYEELIIKALFEG